ncbi:MAG: PQQ-dependent sugar dehydrogenase [Chloroflexota bacterium]|nr:PQQ-dependent sugar dehydrogenase [Chloroflexota bacterium]
MKRIVIARIVLMFLVVLAVNVTSRDTVIADLPERPGHNTTTVRFGPDDRLYVARGSTCNVCEENDPRYAAVWVYEADGSDEHLLMKGLRNAVGLAVNPVTEEVWASNNGRDMLGNDIPPETIYILEEGADAGWPHCHAGDIIDSDYGNEGACEGVAQPAVEMQAHSAHLALPSTTPIASLSSKGDLFVAFHGSWNRVPPTGYKTVRVPMEDGRVAGEVEDFATGWLLPNDESPGRPVGVTAAADGTLLVSDDKRGFIYRIVPS